MVNNRCSLARWGSSRKRRRRLTCIRRRIKFVQSIEIRRRRSIGGQGECSDQIVLVLLLLMFVQTCGGILAEDIVKMLNTVVQKFFGGISFVVFDILITENRSNGKRAHILHSTAQLTCSQINRQSENERERERGNVRLTIDQSKLSSSSSSNFFCVLQSTIDAREKISCTGTAKQRGEREITPRSLVRARRANPIEHDYLSFRVDENCDCVYIDSPIIAY